MWATDVPHTSAAAKSLSFNFKPIEKSNSVEILLDLSILIPEFLKRVRATGSIIAATVCSPINEDMIAETPMNPKEILQVLFPVSFTIIKAKCLSSP